jgi:8-oxo-dGTP diphosphatase
MLLKNISVDCVIFGFDGEKLNILLWQADPDLLIHVLQEKENYEQIKFLYESHPSLTSEEQTWGLIGAHAPEEMGLDEFAQDITTSCTGLTDVYLKQFHTFGSVHRVPYFRVITIGYYALINPRYHNFHQSPLTRKMQWFGIDELPPLCFDHKEIIFTALAHLRETVQYHPVGFHLLPERFTLTGLQAMYEVIMGEKMDIRNFRKKIHKMELLEETGEKQENVPHRAARLFRFEPANYDRLIKEGLTFRI